MTKKKSQLKNKNEILLWSHMGLVYLNVWQMIVHDFKEKIFSLHFSVIIQWLHFFFFLDVLLHVGSRCQASQQHTAGGFLCPLHGASFQSAVPSLRAAGVHFQRLFDVDRVQVEEHQRTHILGSQSWPGGKPVSPYSPIHLQYVDIVHKQMISHRCALHEVEQTISYLF